MNGIKWFVYSNLWVSINAVAFYLFTINVLDIEVNYEYALLLFFATLFAYNFQRFLKITGEVSLKKNSERHVWIDRNQLTIQALSVLGLVGMTVFSIRILPFELMLASLPALLVVMFYTRKNEKLRAIRKLPFLKIFVISLVWTFTAAVVPLLLIEWNWNSSSLIFLVLLFLFVMILCIPFDIRDRELDKEQLKTLPVVLGVKGSKILSISLMMIIAIASLFLQVWSLSLVALSVIPSLMATNEQRSELFFTGWIEAQFLVLLLLQWAIDVI